MQSKPQERAIFERTIINENGEILEHETVHKRTREPDFIKLYLDCILIFKSLSKTLNPILIEFLKHMSYAHDDQLIYVNLPMKKSIAQITGKTVKRIDQALADFVKGNIFKRLDRGLYQVNANIFGRGEWKDIKRIRSTFDFNLGTIETNIEKEKIEED